MAKKLYRIHVSDLSRLDEITDSYIIHPIHPKFKWLAKLAWLLPATHLRALMLTLILCLSNKIIGEDKLLVEIDL